jgi:hypothetical protein
VAAMLRKQAHDPRNPAQYIVTTFIYNAKKRSFKVLSSHLDSKDECQCHECLLTPTELLQGHGLSTSGERHAHLVQ